MHNVRPYIKLIIPEMKLRVLDIDILLIQVSITGGRRVILHYIGSLRFFTVAILKTIQKAGRTQDIEC